MMAQCPICHRSYKNVYRHVRHSIDGLGDNPEAHIEWAENKGIHQSAIVFGNPDAIQKLKDALDDPPSN